MIIHDEIASMLPTWRNRVKYLVQNYGSSKVCDVTVEQIYGGIRGVQIQVSDISYVDPHRGILLRGFSIPEVLAQLPRAEGSAFPLAGGLYYLLMVDRMPSLDEALAVEREWKDRSTVPEFVYDVLAAMPPHTHPMTLFSQALLCLQTGSTFARRYNDGLGKADYWEATLEDSLDLTAKLPTIAAFIYNQKYQHGLRIDPDPDLDWSANFSHMIGQRDSPEYRELCRLFFVLHSDHEGANVSAHTSHLVNSALSDVYLSCAAAMNGLAGPLHGLANQECIRWLLSARASFDHFPSPSELAQFAWDQLNAGRLIPGYGHAVLRVTDPRFTAQYEFANQYLPDDELFRFVKLVYEVLPGVLTRFGKVKNPWPNVDAINGTLQYHYGIREFDFYTVLFGMSRILGLSTHAVWARALGKPIERPKSLTTRMLEEMVGIS